MTAFMIGFLGSIHCVGMCGGIVGLLGTGIQERGGRSLYRHLPMWIGYNCGRLASYTLAGGLAGVLGVFALSLFTPHRAQTLGLMFAGSFMVLLGLYLTGWWSGIQWLERIGGEVWKLIEPLGRRYYSASKSGSGCCSWNGMGLAAVLAWSILHWHYHCQPDRLLEGLW